MQPVCLYITCGIPGSGKTTYLKNNYPNLPAVSPDEIRKELTGSEGNKSADTEVFTLVKSRITAFLENRQSCAYDATNTGINTRRKFINLARKYNAEPICIWLDTDLGSAIQMDAQRQLNGGRHVPINIISRMYYSLREPSLSEGFTKIIKHQKY